MFNPDQLHRLRLALAADPALDRFDGHPCHVRPLRLGGVPAALLGEEDTAPLLRAGPAHVFGTPPDPACLHGIGPTEDWVPGPRLLRVADAAVIGNAAVLDGDGALFCPDVVASPRAARALVGGVGAHGIAVSAAGDGFRCHHAGRAAPRAVAADALFLHDLEGGNYGSFLFRQLPQMLLAARLQPQFDCYVVPERTAFFREAVELLGLPRCPAYTVREVCGDRFRSVVLGGADAEGLLSAGTTDALRALARRLGQVEGAPRHGRLYVSRSLSTAARPWYRPLVNEDEVEAMAVQHGFVPCCPETLTLAQQVSGFAAATAVAGPSGSGMLNAAFAPVGAAVLDLESFTTTVRQHAKLYASTGKRYSFAFGEWTDDTEGGPVFRPWRMDPAVLRAGLAWAVHPE